MRTDEIVVASVPADHPFVRRTTPDRTPSPTSAQVRVLPDPDPDDPTRAATGRWWPPVVLRPAWAAAAGFDLAHLHFGYDAATPEELRAWCEALRRRGRPLVLTLHDLRNPHHEDASLLPRQLDVLLPAADAVLTLTPHAAARIEQGWGVRATVAPHPHLVDLPVVRAVRDRRRAAASTPGAPVVGVAAKELRASTDVARLLPALTRAVERLDARLVVTVHREALRRGDDRAVALADALRAASRRSDVEVVAHDRWDDATLWQHVAGLDAAVLPYRWGTHSGWLEMCHDLGTSVVAPSFGGFADQGADAVYEAGETWVDDDSLEQAVVTALEGRGGGRLPGLDADGRAQQLDAVRALVGCTYADALQRADRRERSVAGAAGAVAG